MSVAHRFPPDGRHRISAKRIATEARFSSAPLYDCGHFHLVGAVERLGQVGFVADAACWSFGDCPRTLSDAGDATASAQAELCPVVVNDRSAHPRAAGIVARNSGRALATVFPIAVEMVHGDPFPASTTLDAASVGVRAIQRWLRPACHRTQPRSIRPTGLH